MEDPAVYQAAIAADRRELVAPVAAWLAGLGFQRVDICPAEENLPLVDLQAGWQAPDGSYFFLMLIAWPQHARCQFSCSDEESPYCICCDWRWVESLAEVQWLLTQDCRFRRVATAAGLVLPARVAASAPVVPPGPAAPAAPMPAAAG